MTTKELNNFLSKAKDKDWFTSKTQLLEFSQVAFRENFKGVSALHAYVTRQLSGWKKEIDGIDRSEFNPSLNYFKNAEAAISNFVEKHYDTAENLDSVWSSQVESQFNISQRNNTIPFDSPEAIFLVEIEKNSSKNLRGAYDYLLNNTTSSVTQKEYYIGVAKAFEFESTDPKSIASRKKSEKASISKIRSDFQKLLSQSQTDLTEHISETRSISLEFGRDLMNFQKEKTDGYDKWFKTATSDFETFDVEALKKLKNLENTYKQKLKLEEPAKYWSDRATKLKRQGWIAMAVVVLIVILTTIFLGKLLWETPDSILLSWFKDDKSSAIRWSIIYITLISFVAFCLRAVIRVMFSSFHLSRDSEERHTLTYFYLSLLKDSKVDDEDKRLIMQSLFSRADTGLIKEDSSPKMPSDITKFFEK